MTTTKTKTKTKQPSLVIRRLNKPRRGGTEIWIHIYQGDDVDLAQLAEANERKTGRTVMTLELPKISKRSKLGELVDWLISSAKPKKSKI